MDTTLTIKIPRDLRDAAKSTAAAMGLPLSTVIHRQLRDFVAEGKITFVAPVALHRVSAGSLPRDAKKKLVVAKRTANKDFVDL